MTMSSMSLLLSDMVAPVFSRILNALAHYNFSYFLQATQDKTSVLHILIESVLRNNCSQTLSQNYTPLGQATRLGSLLSSILTVGLVFGLCRYARRTSNRFPMSVSQSETEKTNPKDQHWEVEQPSPCCNTERHRIVTVKLFWIRKQRLTHLFPLRVLQGHQELTFALWSNWSNSCLLCFPEEKLGSGSHCRIAVLSWESAAKTHRVNPLSNVSKGEKDKRVASNNIKYRAILVQKAAKIATSSGFLRYHNVSNYK